MYLFSRQLLLRGDPRSTGSWARDMATLVSRKTGLGVSLWQATGGAPLGTFVFSTFVESHATLDGIMDQLAADEEYLDLAMAAQAYGLAPPEDSLVEIVHAAGGNYQRAELGAVVSLVSAVMMPGKYTSALRWSVELADLVSEITSTPSLFARNVVGGFDGVEWIQTVPDPASLDRLGEQLAKDGRYLAKLDENAGLFIGGSARRMLGRRVA